MHAQISPKVRRKEIMYFSVGRTMEKGGKWQTDSINTLKSFFPFSSPIDIDPTPPDPPLIDRVST